ncbi:MAG TPA: DNA polymerase III subunit beta [Dehalococcoidia bacterium]|jgi:DNA polymerase-3 subunit beta|nr:DNA polymerase III subunit beta [Dehalococcoidia bacterium]
MKISCLQENLSRGLAIVGRAVATRATLPVTQNVLLSVEKSMLKLSATNLEIAITTNVGATIEEEGAITVPARLLTEFVSSLPNDKIDLEIQPGSAVLQLTCGRSKATIHGTDASEFPPIPTVDDGISAQVDPLVLKSAIARVAFAAATEESRPVLTGVELKIEGERFSLAAADGFRLAVHHGSLISKVESEIKVIIPARTLNELSRLLGDQEEPVDIMMTPAKGQVLFRVRGGETVEVVSQLLQGAFPNYEQLIPERHDTRAILDLPALLRAVRTAAIFARDGSNIIRLELVPSNGGGGNGKVIISAKSEEVGDNEDEVDADAIEGNEGKIAFNSRYLLDVLTVLDKGKVALETTSSSSPGVFRPTDSDDYTHVVMPMFVQW